MFLVFSPPKETSEELFYYLDVCFTNDSVTRQGDLLLIPTTIPNCSHHYISGAPERPRVFRSAPGPLAVAHLHLPSPLATVRKGSSCTMVSPPPSRSRSCVGSSTSLPPSLSLSLSHSMHSSILWGRSSNVSIVF